MHIAEKRQLVLKLEVMTKPGVHLPTQGSAFWIVVYPLWMDEGGASSLAPQAPGKGKKALEQVALRPRKLRVVACVVKEVLLPLHLFVGTKVAPPQPFVLKKLLPQGRHPGCAVFSEYQKGRGLPQHVPLGPLQFYPGRVAQHQVEPAPAGEDVSKLHLPVEEAAPGSKIFGHPQPLVAREQRLHVDHAKVKADLLRLPPGLRGKEGQLVPSLRGAVHHAAQEDELQVEEPLLPGGQEVRSLQGPEPQGAPVVHGQF